MDEALQAKATQYAVQLINETRRDNKLPPLEHDSNLELAALDHCKSMASEGFFSHFGQDGDKPYQRYFRHGCTDHVMENIYSLDAEDEEKSLLLDDAAITKIIEDIHHSFCSQEAPHDNDLQNVLNPAHTHVGIAIFATEQRLRYVEVYVDRYAVLTADSLPFHVGGSEGQEEEVVVDVEGTVFQYDTYGPFCCLVYSEVHPGPLSLDALTTTYGTTTYMDGSDEVVATVRPWEIMFDKTTGVFHFPVRLPHAQQDATYYMVVYVKPDLSSIPYEDEVEDLKMPDEGCIPVVTWVMNLKGLEPSDNEARLMEGLHGDDDIFSQSSSKNMEEEMAKTYARRALGAPEKEPLTDIQVAIGKGSLNPGDDMAANNYMSQERHERVTSYNLNVWFSRAGEEDDDAQVIEDIVILSSSNESLPMPPPGYELIPRDLAAVVDDEPKDIGQLEQEFHAFFCIKRVPRSAATSPIVDLVLVYGTRSFQMGSAYETTAFPEELNSLFLANLFLCTKRKGAARTATEKGEEESAAYDQQPVDAALVYESGAENPMAAAADPAYAAGTKDEGAGAAVYSEDGQVLHDDVLDPELTSEQIMELEKKRAIEQAKRTAAQHAEAELQRKQEILAEMRASLRQREEERAELLREQIELQKKLAAFMATQKMRDTSGAGSGQQEPQKEKDAASAAENERQYADSLNVILDIKAKIRRQKNESDVVAGELQYRLDEKQFKADAIASSFRDFKREIALTSENSRTGKPIPERMVDEFERWEAKKNEEMEKIRLKNIMLRMTLKKLEKSLRTKEQLAEGLHLIDFEQLKIENQTLSEKIEERNEELQKLRKKNTVTVQVLTHVKEKLQYVAVENSTIKQRLSKLDHDVGHSREKLRRAKRERDRLRGENNVLKQNQGFASSDLLVLDYEQRKAKLEMMRSNLAQLKDQHRVLHQQVKTLQDHTASSPAMSPMFS